MNRQFRKMSIFVLLLIAASSVWAAKSKSSDASTVVVGKVGARSQEEVAFEGEKRFRANCGRCHQPPHKFPPGVMATAIRHMRVRANITDEDMQLILKYMTQ